jgi:general secretion pathway protein H
MNSNAAAAGVDRRAGDAAAARLRPVHGGFTLIEMLVVIVIIGVMAAAATLSMGILGRDHSVEEQSRRFWAVLRQAREESELQGLDVGVALTPTDYAFQRFNSRTNQWTPIEQDKLYAPRTLPEGLRFRLWLDGREVVLKPMPERDPEQEEKRRQRAEAREKRGSTGQQTEGEEDESQDAQDLEPTPQIVVLSSGDVMPFELQIERDGQQSLWRVVAQPDNDLRVERRADNSTWQVVAQTRVEPDVEDSRDDSRRNTNARR